MYQTVLTASLSPGHLEQELATPLLPTPFGPDALIVRFKLCNDKSTLMATDLALRD